ncbi:Protein CBG13373 [Caenorhabditis briggsae]|uniref:Protein CBG13373 n=1 Tax=Caenorhabditis briggsae TaxID=6238 RepID=A8XHX3_CAEBR|nr:Protein CBG13373 [Caenorhabditis briggsae]CAP32239.1 Protein CBG13373 [Caenorhabditis briggsae]
MATVPSIKDNFSTSELLVATNTEPCPKRIVGYFTEWEKSELRKEQLQKLTDVIYLFVPLQENGTIDSEKEWSDSRFGDLKNKALSLKPALKVMIGVGGNGVRFEFRQIVSDDTERKALVDSITSFIVEHDLDGVDVFWKWPFKHTRISYVIFLRELRTPLDTLRYKMYRQVPYIISIIAPRIHSEFDGFDLEEIMQIVDFVNVLTYDYFYTTHKVGPLSLFYGGREGNVDRTMKYLTCMTENPSKLNLGVAFYGTTYNVTDSLFEKSFDNLWISKDSKTTGPFGTSWSEISSNEKALAKWDNASRTPYTWDGRKFFTFENERSMREKMEYAKEHNIGGIVVWVIDQDDDKSTLLNVVYSVFMGTLSCDDNKEIDNVTSTELPIASLSELREYRTSDEKSMAKWDNVSKTPYIWHDRKFLAFENEKSMREKMKYAEDHNIGGILIWGFDEDDDKPILLNVVSSVDLCTESSLLTYNCVIVFHSWFPPCLQSQY